MSRSWTERLRRDSPAAAGLALGRHYVALAEMVPGAGAARVKSVEEIALEAPLFSGAPSAAAAAALERALSRFAGKLAKRYLPLHVSLPDPLVHWSLFELDALPAGRAAREELVAFRFSRQGLDGGHLYACQPLGEEAGKQLALGMAIDRPWHALLTTALAKAGMVAWTIQANTCRQFNAFHDQLAGRSGALVTLAPDAWSLALWDASGRLRHARGRWRAGGEDHGEIAAEVERAILAYVNRHPGRDVSRVFVAGDGGAFADALDARLREPCTRLSFHERADAAKPVASAPLAFAAALAQ